MFGSVAAVVMDRTRLAAEKATNVNAIRMGASRSCAATGAPVASSAPEAAKNASCTRQDENPVACQEKQHAKLSHKLRNRHADHFCVSAYHGKAAVDNLWRWPSKGHGLCTRTYTSLFSVLLCGQKGNLLIPGSYRTRNLFAALKSAQICFDTKLCRLRGTFSVRCRWGSRRSL